MRYIPCLIILLFPSLLYSQVRKEVNVTYNKNSYLFFPGDVKFLDVGSEDLLANFEDNMVIITSAIPEHEQTSLFVSSENGGRFFFLVSYHENPEKYIYNYEGDKPAEIVQVEAVEEQKSSKDTLYIFNDFNPVTDGERDMLKESVELIANDGTRVYDIGISKKKLMFKARGVYYDGDFIYLSLELFNYSQIDYEMDFVKFFMVNTKGAAKKTFQEEELNPVVRYHPLKVARPDGGINVIYGFRKFTMTDKKLKVDIWEHRGDRRLEITVNESDILKAARVQELN